MVLRHTDQSYCIWIFLQVAYLVTEIRLKVFFDGSLDFCVGSLWAIREAKALRGHHVVEGVAAFG